MLSTPNLSTAFIDPLFLFFGLENGSKAKAFCPASPGNQGFQLILCQNFIVYELLFHCLIGQNFLLPCQSRVKISL